MEYKTCLRCNATWLNKIEHPLRCPRCQSINWDIPRKRNKPMEGDDNVQSREKIQIPVK